MENVADALRMAFAVIVFVIAMAIALGLLSQANATTTQIFYSMDKITYLDKAPISDEDDANHRIVGLETIIPTIYRYPVENCGVTIIDKDGKIVARYDLETDNVSAFITNYHEADKSTETYKQAARSYLLHMTYLTEKLKDHIRYSETRMLTGENQGFLYAYNEELALDIENLYKYYTYSETGEESEHYRTSLGN